MPTSILALLTPNLTISNNPFVQVLVGVGYCHSMGICHRDLKPENILLTFDERNGECVDLKLCDFGLSTHFQHKTLLTDFCGSPGFFGPEMILHGAYVKQTCMFICVYMGLGLGC